MSRLFLAMHAYSFRDAPSFRDAFFGSWRFPVNPYSCSASSVNARETWSRRFERRTGAHSPFDGYKLFSEKLLAGISGRHGCASAAVEGHFLTRFELLFATN
jgi:hypothetical protein